MNCDLIAPHYWWIERLGMGRTLERRRRWFLPEIGNARRALVLGDGDGRFLKELLRRNSVLSADYVDLSGRMLELARQKAGVGAGGVSESRRAERGASRKRIRSDRDTFLLRLLQC